MFGVSEYDIGRMTVDGISSVVGVFVNAKTQFLHSSNNCLTYKIQLYLSEIKLRLRYREQPADAVQGHNHCLL